MKRRRNFSSKNCSRNLKNAISNCLNMEQELAHNPQSRSIPSLRKNLEKCANTKTTKGLRSNGKSDERKKVEDSFREVSTDLLALQRKLDGVFECVMELLDKVESLETRIECLENKQNERSYAAVTSNTSSSEDTIQRMDKLEFFNSEQERNKRSLEVSICHPNINPNDAQLEYHLKDFFSDTMKMTQREIDLNYMKVRKTRKDHTVIVTLSEKRYKKFIYTAKKKLRNENDSACDGLYVSDNLTAYNASLLMEIKKERTRRLSEGLSGFQTVYTFEGKVFVKMRREDKNDEAIYIKNRKVLQEFMARLSDGPERVNEL